MAKDIAVKMSADWYKRLSAVAKKEGRTIKGQLSKIFEHYFNADGKAA